MAVIVVGTLFSLVLCWLLPVSLPDMVGILCGATTNTPAWVLPSRLCSSWDFPAAVLPWAVP